MCPGIFSFRRWERLTVSVSVWESGNVTVKFLIIIIIGDEEFEELCFDFGIELDDVVSDLGVGYASVREYPPLVSDVREADTLKRARGRES